MTKKIRAEVRLEITRTDGPTQDVETILSVLEEELDNLSLDVEGDEDTSTYDVTVIYSTTKDEESERT